MHYYGSSFKIQEVLDGSILRPKEKKKTDGTSRHLLLKGRHLKWESGPSWLPACFSCCVMYETQP